MFLILNGGMNKINRFFKANNNNPLIIAEISGNHQKSLTISKKIIDKVAESGAQMVKFQTFEPEEMTVNLKKKIFQITNKKNIWYGKYYYELYKRSHLSYDLTKELFEYSYSKNLTPFSSEFDLKSLEFLEKINCKLYKIASFENTDHVLIKNVAMTKKPIIISSGLASERELDMTINLIKKYGSSKIILLKCTSNYPAKFKDLNLKTISDMKKKYAIKIGFSDHTIGSTAAIVSIGQGSEVIEKHICLKKGIGIDSKFSLTAKDLKVFVNDCKNAYSSIGKIFYGPTKNEKQITKGSRSLYYNGDFTKGSRLEISDFKRCRPGYGIKVYLLNKIINKKLLKNVKFGDPTKLSDFFTSK